MHLHLNNQGLKYLQNKSKYNRRIRQIEGLENMETQHNHKDKILHLENEFNKKLEQYKTAYHSYLTNLRDNHNSIIHNFKNKNIFDKNGKIYYVNKFGYVRGYSDIAWNKKPSSCPSSKPDNESYKYFNNFQKGLDLAPGQPCDLDGKLIINNNSDTIAWITPDGRRREFPTQEIYQNVMNNGSCKSSPVKVSSNIFNMFPKGSDMTSSDNCNISLTTTNEWNYIVELNNELINISNQIYNEITKMESTDTSVDNVMIKTKNELLSSIDKLNKERNNFKQFNNLHNGISANWSELKLQEKSNYYKYLLWTVASVSLGAITIKHIMK